MIYNKTYNNSKVWPSAYAKQPIIWGYEQFEDTKVITRSRKSKKDRQHDGQKGQSMTYISLHRKLRIEHHEPGSSCSTKYFPRKIN